MAIIIGIEIGRLIQMVPDKTNADETVLLHLLELVDIGARIDDAGGAQALRLLQRRARIIVVGAVQARSRNDAEGDTMIVKQLEQLIDGRIGHLLVPGGVDERQIGAPDVKVRIDQRSFVFANLVDHVVSSLLF